MAGIRYGEIKSGALVFGGFGPDGSAVLADDAIDSGEADAGAFELVGTVETLENTEKFIGVFHVETNTVIANEDCGVPVELDGTDFDNGDATGAGVFDSVGQQIGEDLFH